MTESRVDRLLRRAEEAAESGEYDRSEALLDVLRPAIYLRNREVKELQKMVAFDE
jgi:hypothetical protein